MKSRILQILPRQPGSHDGIGDYALILSERLQSAHSIESIFIAPPFDNAIATENARGSAILFHYVNYGYQARGVPRRLPSFLQRLKESCGARLVTILHELYASGPPWRSEFWLQPMQKSIARNIAQLSDTCVVSNETMRDQLHRLAPPARIAVHPVVSTLGEPVLPNDQFVRRDPHRWAIFGGDFLLQRSFKSFRQQLKSIPASFSPKEVYLLGGSDNPIIRRKIAEMDSVVCHHHPAIEAGAASEILSSCSFAWIDYFRQHNVPTDVILKSGSFASYCAHGVIPVFPRRGSAISLHGDQLPGPYVVSAARNNLPSPAERGSTSKAICDWYHRHASVAHLSRAIAAALC